MKFSIVVPYCNAEKWLPSCIESVTTQTYGDWEILLVDDASSDSGPEICSRYASVLGTKVKLLSAGGKGPLIARRLGYAASTGNILISLDSDDALRADALERLSEAFSQHPCDVVIFGCSRTPDFLGSDLLRPFSSSIYLAGKDMALCMRRLCTSNALNSMCAKAVLRECMDLAADYSQWEGLIFAEDLLQSLSVLDSAKAVYYLDEKLYFYRVNYESSTKKFNPAQLEMRDAVNAVQRLYAKRWEAQFRNDSFVRGVLTMGLSSYGDMAQGACESLPITQAVGFMEELVRREQFDLYWTSGSLADLRPDIRFIVESLKHGFYGRIWFFSRIKAMVRKRLGR